MDIRPCIGNASSFHSIADNTRVWDVTGERYHGQQDKAHSADAT
jgi:hypothetical protein